MHDEHCRAFVMVSKHPLPSGHGELLERTLMSPQALSIDSLSVAV